MAPVPAMRKGGLFRLSPGWWERGLELRRCPGLPTATPLPVSPGSPVNYLQGEKPKQKNTRRENHRKVKEAVGVCVAAGRFNQPHLAGSH